MTKTVVKKKKGCVCVCAFCKVQDIYGVFHLFISSQKSGNGIGARKDITFHFTTRVSIKLEAENMKQSVNLLVQ